MIFDEELCQVCLRNGHRRTRQQCRNLLFKRTRIRRSGE